MKKRYCVCSFPASREGDFYTDSYFKAWLSAQMRRFAFVETRIIDTKTNKHCLVI